MGICSLHTCLGCNHANVIRSAIMCLLAEWLCCQVRLALSISYDSLVTIVFNVHASRTRILVDITQGEIAMWPGEVRHLSGRRFGRLVGEQRVSMLWDGRLSVPSKTGCSPVHVSIRLEGKGTSWTGASLSVMVWCALALAAGKEASGEFVIY